MSKMNPEIKSKWVAALRSGEYQQTEERLCDGEGGFCCLGVLSDLHMKATGNGEWSEDYFRHPGYRADGIFKEDVPPRAVLDWAGMGSENPMMKLVDAEGEEYRDTIAELNDSGRTFAEIADLIEAQL